MGDTSAEKTVKRSWWKEFKGEFKKIVWPDKKSLVKQTIVVTVATVIVGAIISVLDWVFMFGISLLQLR